jgi:hypothetical protein
MEYEMCTTVRPPFCFCALAVVRAPDRLCNSGRVEFTQTPRGSANKHTPSSEFVCMGRPNGRRATCEW